MLATRYEFTDKTHAHTISFVQKKGWSVIRYPAGAVKIPPIGEILTDEGWNPLIPTVQKDPRYFDTAENCHKLVTAHTSDEAIDTERDDDAFGVMSNYFADRIRQLTSEHKGVLVAESDIDVVYSAFDTDKMDVPLDNLDEVAFEGKFIVVAEYDDYWDGSIKNEGSKYASKDFLTNPTWLDLAVEADKAIKTTCDTHHIFFEGATVKNSEFVNRYRLTHLVKTIELSFGS